MHTARHHCLSGLFDHIGQTCQNTTDPLHPPRLWGWLIQLVSRNLCMTTCILHLTAELIGLRISDR